MPRRTTRPVHAEKLTTYDELRFYAKKFGQGLYNCLIFVGPPGRLKSSIIEEATKGNAHLISGHAMPFEIFCEVQEHQNENLIVDDADGLYKEAQGQRLLKAITNPKKPTRVGWHSSAPLQRGLLKEFETTSNVCIIDNGWNVQNEHIAAIEDRGRLFLFDPPPSEVHKEMANQTWFTDQEVYDFIGDNLTLFSDLSARTYVKAGEAKEAGEDWRKYVLKKCCNEDDLIIFILEYDPAWTDKTTEEKNQEYRRRTGKKSRATYFNRRKKLVENLKGHPLVGKWAFDPTPLDLDQDIE